MKKEKQVNKSLASLQKDLAKIQRAEAYLTAERNKLKEKKEAIRARIRRERELIRLKDKIAKVRSSKK